MRKLIVLVVLLVATFAHGGTLRVVESKRPAPQQNAPIQFTEVVPFGLDDFMPCGTASQCVIPSGDDGYACTSDAACGHWAHERCPYSTYMFLPPPAGSGLLGVCFTVCEVPAWLQWRWGRYTSIVVADCS